MRARASKCVVAVLAGVGMVATVVLADSTGRAGEASSAGVEVVLPSLETGRLCGVNAAYVAMRLLGGEVEYGDVVDAFPQAEAQGTSLEEVRGFFERRGVPVGLRRMSERELGRRSGSLAIVLVPGGEMPHMVVRRAVGDGRVQTLDPTGGLVSRAASETDERRRASLVLGGEADGRSDHGAMPAIALGVVLLAAGGGLIWRGRQGGVGRCAAVLAMIALLAGCRGNQPRAHVESPQFDAGVVAVPEGGLQLDHRFAMENHGSSALRILEVAGSCACISLEAPAAIEAGETGYIHAALRLTRADIDPKSYRIAVHTDDVAHPVIGLEFRARAAPAPYAVPDSLTAGSHAGDRGRARCRVYYPQSTALRKFIDHLEILPPVDGLDARIENETRQARTGGMNDGLYMYSADLVIEGEGQAGLPSAGKLADQASWVAVRFVDGQKLRIPIVWAEGEPGGDAQFSLSRAKAHGNNNP